MTTTAGLRILVADDDPAMRTLLVRLLVGLGYQAPVAVATGAEAIAAAAQADVILLDHQLPDASGVDLIETIRAHPAQPAVIMVTAHGSESLAAEALRRGADDYVVKDGVLPEFLPQVLERVRRTRALRSALESAERELVRTERLAAIGEMTVTLHHEINNPLMSASAEVELLLGDPSLTADQRQGLRAVQGSLGRIRDIVKRARELRQAQATEYVAGTQMIDLSGGATPPQVTARGTAAILLGDPDLARVVSLLLGQEGFIVQRCRTADDLVRWAGTLGTSLVVVQGAASGGANDPLGGFVPQPDRYYKLVALVTGDATRATEAGADLALALPIDPVAFARDVALLLA